MHGFQFRLRGPHHTQKQKTAGRFDNDPVPESKADKINGNLFLMEEAESVYALRLAKNSREHNTRMAA